MIKSSTIVSDSGNSSLVSNAREATLRLIELKQKAVQNFLEAGEIFKTVQENKLWEVEGAESFNSYVAELGYDRTTVLKMMLVFDTFGKENLNSDSNHNPLLDAGWVKLAKVAPHVTEDNYSHMLELATSNSLSDIDDQLVKEGYITKKEFEAQNVECPFCHKVFTPTQRKESHYAKEDYNQVIKAYEKAKETKFEGKEYDPIMQTIRTMFFNGRTPEQIIATIEFMADQNEYDWTIRTVQNKIAEILPQLDLVPKEVSEEDKKLLKGVGIE